MKEQAKTLADLEVVKEYKGVPAGRVFEFRKKLYKILGFEVHKDGVTVWAQRILKTTLKISGKQPLLEGFPWEDTTNQQISLKGILFKK